MQTTEKLHEVLSSDIISLEQAQALKQEVRANRDYSSRDLEALMHEYKAKGEKEYYANLHGAQKFFAYVREFFGRGARYEYQQHLRQLDGMSVQLGTLATNAKELVQEYREKLQTTRTELYEDRKIFELNAVIYQQKQQQLNECRESLETLKSASVLGTSCTTEALKCHKDLLEYESEIIDLNHENDQIAVQITVNNGLLESQQQTYARLQDLYSSAQRQLSVFNAHHELARAQERIITGVRGVDSAAEIYMQSAVLVQQLTGLQERIDKTPIENLPKEFMLGAPKHDGKRDPTRPYWMTVADEIRSIGSHL
jgi:hypothetical protein